MKNTTIILLFSALLLFAACMQKEKSIESEQSIQEIMSDVADYVKFAENKTTSEEKNIVEEKNESVNENKTTETEEVVEETEPSIHKKCKNSTIISEGCRWNEKSHTTFNFKIRSASKIKIPGVWMRITGESGGVYYVKRVEDIISGAARTYILNYEDMKKEVGKVTKLEVLPIEKINGTEYACENQRVYTVPEVYCKSKEAIRINDDGSINETG